MTVILSIACWRWKGDFNQYTDTLMDVLCQCEHGYFNEIKAAEQLERSHSTRPVMFHKKFLFILSLPVCPESAWVSGLVFPCPSSLPNTSAEGCHFLLPELSLNHTPAGVVAEEPRGGWRTETVPLCQLCWPQVCTTGCLVQEIRSNTNAIFFFFLAQAMTRPCMT